MMEVMDRLEIVVNKGESGGIVVNRGKNGGNVVNR